MADCHHDARRRVFINYARADAERVQGVVARLGGADAAGSFAARFCTYMDTTAPPTRTNQWEPQLWRSFDECPVLLSFVSPAWLRPDSYAQLEYGTGGVPGAFPARWGSSCRSFVAA